jgi:hypothetical protein
MTKLPNYTECPACESVQVVPFEEVDCYYGQFYQMACAHCGTDTGPYFFDPTWWPVDDASGVEEVKQKQEEVKKLKEKYDKRTYNNQ